MSVKTVPKTVVKKSNVKMNKQDELDELEELKKLDNLLNEGSDFSTLQTAPKTINGVTKSNNTQKNTLTKNPTININEDEKTEVVDKRRARKLISSLPQQKTFMGHEKAQQQLIDDTSDLYDNLESDLLPKNYGNKWSEEDKGNLIDFLKKSTAKEIDYADIALKLGRSEGGVKGEVKKMIIKRYLGGEEPDLIAIDLNIQYKFVKILIKSYIDNEIEMDISNLEKENKFLKLKMENMELRKNMQKTINNKEQREILLIYN